MSQPNIDGDNDIPNLFSQLQKTESLIDVSAMRNENGDKLTNAEIEFHRASIAYYNGECDADRLVRIFGGKNRLQIASILFDNIDDRSIGCQLYIRYLEEEFINFGYCFLPTQNGSCECFEWDENFMIFLRLMETVETRDFLQREMAIFFNDVKIKNSDKIAVYSFFKTHMREIQPEKTDKIIISRYREPRSVLKTYIEFMYETMIQFGMEKRDDYDFVLDVIDVSRYEFVPKKKLLAIALSREDSKFRAADLILELSNDKTLRDKATDIILKYNGEQLYQNKMNVHIREVEVSTIASIGRLFMKKINMNEITFGKAKDSILKVTDNEKIRSSLERINSDSICYFPYNYRLIDVFLRCFGLIQQSGEKKSLLLIRFAQELEDMAGTCVSGFFSRLMNAFSGIDDEIEVSFGLENEMRESITHSLKKFMDEKKLDETESPFNSAHEGDFDDMDKKALYMTMISNEFIPKIQNSLKKEYGIEERPEMNEPFDRAFHKIIGSLFT